METVHVETSYERNQQFNRLVTWLHSIRYKHILGLFESLTKQVVDRRIKVVEIGCAHAKLFSVLDEKFDIDYTGIEVDYESINVARSRYSHRENCSLIHDSA
jgi:hypothetical protein